MQGGGERCPALARTDLAHSRQQCAQSDRLEKSVHRVNCRLPLSLHVLLSLFLNWEDLRLPEVATSVVVRRTITARRSLRLRSGRLNANRTEVVHAERSLAASRSPSAQAIRREMRFTEPKMASLFAYSSFLDCPPRRGQANDCLCIRPRPVKRWPFVIRACRVPRTMLAGNGNDAGG
jgi:hypothetical protein